MEQISRSISNVIEQHQTLAAAALKVVSKMKYHPFHASESILVPITRLLQFIFDPVLRDDMLWSGSKQLMRLLSSTKARRNK